MEISIVNIGNSKGIRLSKTILEKYSIGDKIEIFLEKDYIILKPKAHPRKGWEKAFKKMHENGDDLHLMDGSFPEENFKGSKK